MGLRETIQAGVMSAFIALDNLPQTVTYKSATGNIIRDIEAGTATAEVVSYVVKLVIFTRFIQKEVDKDPAILLSNTKILFPAQNLPVPPKAGDTIIDVENTQWEVVRRVREPSNTLIILEARAV